VTGQRKEALHDRGDEGGTFQGARAWRQHAAQPGVVIGRPSHDVTVTQGRVRQRRGGSSRSAAGGRSPVPWRARSRTGRQREKRSGPCHDGGAPGPVMGPVWSGMCLHPEKPFRYDRGRKGHHEQIGIPGHTPLLGRPVRHDFGAWAACLGVPRLPPRGLRHYVGHEGTRWQAENPI
jgi:hypothetical protein